MSARIVAARGKEKKLAYQLRYKVMCRELGWLPAGEYPESEERDEYDEMQSMTFIALDDGNACVGTSRLIFQGQIPLPIESHFDLYPREFIEKIHGTLRQCAEVSRFIVPEHETLKRHEITLMLCRAMAQTGIQMRVTHMFMAADYRFYRLLKILGFQLEEIGEPKFFMGSKTIPGILSLDNLWPVLKERKPDLHDYLLARRQPASAGEAAEYSGISAV